jgi:quercetin dioxygenase-like cupin family protein
MHVSTARVAAGVLAAATLAAGATACSSRDESTNTTPGATAGASTTSEPPTEVFKPLLQQELPNVKGKSFTSATVSFPPGAKALPHRHGQAFVFAYVLQGSIRSEIEGQPTKTFRAGEYWVESPGAHHVRTENVSTTNPAKLLVSFVADTGAELKVDDTQH